MDEALIARALVDDPALVRCHAIPKRDPRRGLREVWDVIDADLADGLKTLADRFSGFASLVLGSFPHPAAHGYVRGRSILTNASSHLGASWLVRADIKDFFPSISADRVQRMFAGFGIAEVPAAMLAKFATLDGRLPLGFASSPVIANAVCIPLDQQLAALAESRGCTFTRYADDLTFSGEGVAPEREEITRVLASESFELAEHKYKFKKRGQAFYVTGLSVSDPVRAHAPRTFKRRLRQELHYANGRGLLEHCGHENYSSVQTAINRIGGSISFLQGIEPHLAARMKGIWNSILERDDYAQAYATRGEGTPRRVCLYFDESTVQCAVAGLFALGCVVTEDADRIRSRLVTLRDDFAADPFLVGERSLHWADISEATRQRLVELLATMPVRAFIAYQVAPQQYEEVYLSLVGDILRRRFIALDGAHVAIVFEENSQLSLRGLQEKVATIYSDLESRGSRRPVVSPQVDMLSKAAEPCLALPDAFLGVFGRYVGQGVRPRPEGSAIARFEQLRSKVRWIRSRLTDEEFTRRHPLRPWPAGDPRVAVP